MLKIVDNAGDVPKSLIVEQLLTTSSEPSVNIPVVDDDGDKLWEDVTVANKMVIVINSGLNMSIGKTASQVIEYIINYNITYQTLFSSPQNIYFSMLNSRA